MNIAKRAPRWAFAAAAAFLLPNRAQAHGLLPASEPPALAEPEPRPPTSWLPERLKTRSRWSFQFGVGIIGDTTPADYLDAGFNALDGEGQGLTYNFTVAYQFYEFDCRLGPLQLKPQLEAPFMLTLVDENTGDLFPDFNLGVVLRWRDFPWNRFLYTTFAIGPGISYSTRVWEADRQRHPEDSDRSPWKFWMPVEITVALPRFPQHQLVAFIDHQSGGRIFDFGGVDAWGFAYRCQF